MDTYDAVDRLSALASQPRLAAFRLLLTAAPEGLPAGEVARRLGVVQNTMSSHLATLERAGLVSARRHGRHVLYRTETAALNALLAWLVQDCCGGHPEICALNPEFPTLSTSRPMNVLFLCTGNSARSILAEALLNHMGDGRFRAFSAGSAPTGTPNPHALRVLARNGIPTEGLRSKSWDEFAGPDAPELDFIFTVCDNAAGETCPIWPGKPASAHWGLPDPAAVDGSDAVKGAAFAETYAQLARRLEAFLALPLESLEKASLKAELSRITREADA